MREIKFRAWNIAGKQMRYDAQNDVIDITDKHELLDTIGYTHTTFFAIAPHDPNMVLMQFTGLHDKNGKEIYEGDIVKMYIQGTKPQPVEITSSVDFSQGTFTAMALNGEPLPLKDSMNAANKTGMGIEIIGSIYENPELLN